MPCKPRQTRVRTLEQAAAYVRQAGICGIFSDGKAGLPSLWDIVDLPGRQPGEKGWGEKITSIWHWKNKLPALHPDEIFYGKIPGGYAVLMTLEHLSIHYQATHRPIRACSPLAQKLYAAIQLDPVTTGALRKEMEMTRRPERTRFDQALQELQITLNIVRRNDPSDKNDTWVPFSEQYVEIARNTP